jgi:o-succinylbenzoate---CoA ligase
VGYFITQSFALKNIFVQHQKFDRDSLILWAESRMSKAEIWEQEILSFLLEWLSEKQEFTVQTSGSTGAPSQLVFSRKSMEKSARNTATHFKLSEGATVLLCLPVSFIAGKMMIVRAIVNGWNLIWTKPSNIPLTGIDETFDFAAFTPSQVDGQLSADKHAFERIKKVIIGGGVISPRLEGLLHSCTNEVYATYGMTETLTHIAVRQVNGVNASTTFHALDGIQLGLDPRSCLQIMAQHISAEWIITNDVFEEIGSGEFKFIGRADNVINSGGVKLFPEKIEEKLSAIMTTPFYIASQPDEHWGNVVVLFLESEDNDSRQLLMELCRQVLDPYEMPKQIVFRQSFDRTTSGKIIRKA